MTVPAMEASAEPKTLKVTFLIDGEVAHERVCENIVVGEVWYVATPPLKFNRSSKEKSPSVVRMMTRKAKRFESSSPSRYTVAVSRTPKNRFASEWVDATGFAAVLGHRIGRKTGKPVGIVFMQSGTTELKSWIAADDLKLAPSLMDDYKDLATVRPRQPVLQRQFAAIHHRMERVLGSVHSATDGHQAGSGCRALGQLSNSKRFRYQQSIGGLQCHGPFVHSRQFSGELFF